MSREKQIEERNELLNIFAPSSLSLEEAGVLADKIIEAGYSKQSEGEWIVTRTERAWNGAEYPTEHTCSQCRRVQVFAERYCPNCGAKMKGGEC